MAEESAGSIASGLWLQKDQRILALLQFGSTTKREATCRSDLDIAIVAPKIKDPDEMSRLLADAWKNLDTSEPYDIWLFEELPLYMKAQIIENHRVIFCRDLSALYEYLYFYRKLWEDERHRQELEIDQLREILDRI
ncbi:MAG: nucleotidyltransferase [Candidatus Syntrophoarchaeum caldarius]|uniref:Nucleotidyltransferase n=1 Tax=Candidatus Syntropharchaeum caldarium TaxID=1838285 RepID=A0A1F2PCI8_9EURY|nr:MAG: nucleotidyltransferase [Candidatus Syntrophoarchaeum caldarius]